MNFKVDGVVLKARDFGESDRVLTIFDRNLGKLEAVARGVRRARSRLRGPCQPFSHSYFFLWRGRSLDGVSQAELVESFEALRADLIKLAVASYVAELVDAIVHEGDPSPDVYDLVLGVFRWLEELEPTPHNVTLVLRTFELQLLGLGGFGPSLDSCATCGAPAAAWAGGEGPAWIVFGPAAGGVVCPACRAGAVSSPGAGAWRTSAAPAGPAGPASPAGPIDPETFLLAPGTHKAMLRLATSPLNQARVLRLTPGAAKEMERALRAHILYHLDRKLRSLDFLDTVLGG